MDVGKATDAMLDEISRLRRRIDEAYDFAILCAEADPKSAAFYSEIRAILCGQGLSQSDN